MAQPFGDQGKRNIHFSGRPDLTLWPVQRRCQYSRRQVSSCKEAIQGVPAVHPSPGLAGWSFFLPSCAQLQDGAEGQCCDSWPPSLEPDLRTVIAPKRAEKKNKP